MSQLHIQLLGAFQIMQDGHALAPFRTDKIRALLVYLVVEADRPHRRDSLAELLWPEMDNRKALYNLRLSLHRLRQTLGDDADALKIDRQAVQFNAARAWVDVLDFEDAQANVLRHSHPGPAACPTCMARIDAALTHYRGDFLPGFFLGDDLAFAEWATVLRERMHQQALQALTWLADYHQGAGRPAQAIPYVRRQLELEPWRESAHRHLMQLLVQTNQRAAALRQYDHCLRLLHEELGVDPDVETVSVYEQILKAQAEPMDVEQPDAQDRPLASTVPPIMSNLPATDLPFVGRRAELDTLDQWMAEPAVRLVTIAGVGGMGKTRLALACAAAQGESHPQRFPDGIFFIPLSSTSSTDRLLPAIAQATAFTPDQNDPTASDRRQLLAYLQPKQCLLVLDNLEQLLDCDEGESIADLLLNLLRGAPHLKLLVTSRERLHMQMEHVLPLEGLLWQPMATPDLADSPADGYSAIQLFQQSARRIQPNFTLTADDLPHLVTLCRLLEGMPLGLELAAAWTASMPLPKITAEIQNSLDFLAAGLSDRPDRHQSICSVFDDSWSRLSQPEQVLFSQLSLFRGGFTRAAAHAVAGEHLSRMLVLRLLSSLVSKSLLRYDRLADRYNLHELLCQYGANQLTQQPDEIEVRRRFAGHFCHWLSRQASNLKGERQRETLTRIALELENIRAAWRWALQARAADLLADAATSLGLFCLHSGRYGEGKALFAEASSQLEMERTEPLMYHALARICYWQAMFEPAAAQRRRCLERSLVLLEYAEAPQETSRADRAAVMLEFGILARGQGKHDAADRYLAESLALCRLSGDQWGEANVLFELGVRAWRSGEYALSEQRFTQCLSQRRQVGDSSGIAVALEGLAGAAMYSGQTERARRFLSESLVAYQQLDDRIGMARIWIKQAQISWHHELEGMDQFADGLAALRALGARHNVALWTVVYAMYVADQDIDMAARKAEEGRKICLELGHQRGLAIAQGVLSRVALVKGNSNLALELALDYLNKTQALSLSVERSDALIWAGWAWLAQGDRRQAQACVVEALRIPSYWRVACLDLAAILLAKRSANSVEWGWQLLGYAESHYARHRGEVSQQTVHRFLPQAMQDVPAVRIADLKDRGRQLTPEMIYVPLHAALDRRPHRS